MPNNPRPDFVIAGFPKTASTTLAARLATHPSICFSDPKEPNCYIESVHPGMERLDAAKVYHPTSSDQILGEGSVRYGSTHSHPDAASNLFTAAPDAKLIFVVRDPVARAISHWRMLWTEAPDLKSPEEMLEYPWAFDILVTAGKYRRHIEHFLQWFAEDKILVVDFQDITDDFDTKIVTILDHIKPGLTPEGMSHTLSANVTSKQGAAPGSTLNALRSLPLWHQICNLSPEGIRKRFRNNLMRPPPIPEISERFQKRVSDECIEDYHWALDYSKRHLRND